jgi:hypothetical protein
VIVNPWQSKPPQGTGLNRSIGLTSGLVAFWPLLEGSGPAVYDLITGLPLVLGGGATWGSGLSAGLVCTTTGAGAAANVPAALQLLMPLTLAVGIRFVAASSTTCPVFGLNNTSGRIYSLESNSSGPALDMDINGTIVSASPTAVAGTDYVQLATCAAGAQSLYINGISKGSSSVTFTPSYANSSVMIGAQGVAGEFASRTPNVIVYWCALWSRILAFSEIQSVSTNPWQLFAPNPSYWLYKHTAAATSSLFRPATLSLGAGGPFFQTPVNG